MSRRRVFVAQEMIRDGVALLRPEQVHYLRDVLRLRAGDTAEVFDGAGGSYRGTLRFGGGAARVDSLEPVECAEESVSAVFLAQALIKPDRFELVLQKATELGVSEILPIEARYSEFRVGERKVAEKRERWQRIVSEAARQCGRAHVPVVRLPVAFSDLLRSGEQRNASRLLFHHASTRKWHPAAVAAGPVLVCIGPEGGWHSEEAEAAADAGFQIFSLGPRILRAETAAIVSLALVQFRIANFQCEPDNSAD